MARLVPHHSVEDIAHGSERDTAKALVEGLEQEWTVFHSYCWLREDERSSSLAEGEADFVLLHPRYGLLVLEVKGGDVQFFPDTQRWFQNGRELHRSPLVQARENLYQLIGQIQRHRGAQTWERELPCPYGYGVVFPDCRTSGTAPPGGHDFIIADCEDLPRLGEKVKKALRSWDRRREPSAMDPEVYRALKRGVESTFCLVPSLSRSLDRDDAVLIQLTRNQQRVMEGLYEAERVAVEGVAGSGKTLLALHRALAWAEQGKRTLLLCYNRTLAEELNDRQAHPHLTIRHFHGLAREICSKAGVDFSIPRSEEDAPRFWDQEAPDLASDAFDLLPEEKYDAIVVDEAQDFNDHFWLAVSSMAKDPDGPLYYFYDRAQSLYREEVLFPPAVPFRLPENCRNTRLIADTCGSVIGQPIITHCFAPAGVAPEVTVTNQGETARLVEKLLGQLLRGERLNPSQVALLRPFTSSPLEGDRCGPHRLTSSLKVWRQGKGVWSSTIKSFKGLEADVLVLMDIPPPGQGYFREHELYVACSRARHRLFVFTPAREVKDLLIERTGVAAG